MDPLQSAFVPERAIHDNIILSHELVKGYRRKGISPRCLMKVDMKKVYDSQEWRFLEQVLIDLQLPQLFISRIMQSVTTDIYSITINGKATKPFDARRGVRQGDSLSPFLFVLAMEYLTRLMKTLHAQVGFQFHPKCKK